MDCDTMKLYFILLLSAIAMADDTNLEELLHAGNNQFTANMFSEVAKENQGKSVVLSAFSVMTPLAQLALASVGPSHDELLKTIGLPDDAVTKAVFSLVDKKLKSVQGVELKTANKIYIPENYKVNPNYAAVSREVFSSDVAKVDFLKSEATAKEINTWVEEQTNHKIKDLVDPDNLGPDTRAVLVNALYFKGSWKNPFKKPLTRESDFHVSGDKVIKVQMMYNKADYQYGESQALKSKIIELPYVGERTSMIIVLPDEMDGISALLEKLKDLSVLDEESKNMFKVEVETYIPKFKIETNTDLKTVLKKMNVKKVFDPSEARLDNLLENAQDLYVSNAVQKAFIEVNEEGAEAAAANQIGIALKGPAVHFKEYRFVADHPFVFFLKENDNIMFSGIYYG